MTVSLSFSVPFLRVSALLLGFASLPVGVCAAQDIPTTAKGRFEAFDTNRDGVVNKLEYNSDAFFSTLDSDDNNRVSADELQAILGSQADGAPSAADRIRIADNNNDGELTDEEFRRSGQMRFQRLDSNQDGNVDLAELKSGFGRP